jgi:hypothetical protein
MAFSITKIGVGYTGLANHSSSSVHQKIAQEPECDYVKVKKDKLLIKIQCDVIAGCY